MKAEPDKMKTLVYSPIGCTVKLLGSRDDHPLLASQDNGELSLTRGEIRKKGGRKSEKDSSSVLDAGALFEAHYIKEDPSCADEI